MKRGTVAALLFWIPALLALLGPATAADGDKLSNDHEHEADSDDEGESDSAPFMVVVEHGNGRRCGGSLVSLRTALTSAWCVRGLEGGNPRELWALSPGALPTPSRRVARVALVAGAESDSPAPHLQPAWVGAALDIAVLELEAPFGGGARSRPILMATRPEDCATGTVCHIVRVRGRPPHLRIVDAVLVPGETCGAAAPGWPSLRDSALCLTGPTLCSMDRGAGVVCDGKLCGVLSRSARAAGNASQNNSPNTTSATQADSTCGNIHVALSVARMRHFLHCAHTLRACGRGGECSNQCSERQLMVLEASEGGSGGGDSDSQAERFYTSSSSIQRPTATTPLTTERRLTERVAFDNPPTTIGRFIPMFKTEDSSPTRSVPPATMTTRQISTIQESTLRPSFEFEPNRADFRGPARTSRVYLKAGEYGDNAVDYGEAEESGMGGGPGVPATTTAGTAVSMTTVPGTFTPVILTLKSNSAVTSNSMHSFLTYTEDLSTKTTTSHVSTKKPSSIAVRLSKLDAQRAPKTNLAHAVYVPTFGVTCPMGPMGCPTMGQRHGPSDPTSGWIVQFDAVTNLTTR
ncbi:unnamed protein product [Arctia plantaginis]|uniref:Peptidase S1 domain-containing protein n=1 Tax=Arctia plantaginis TaxID=874455 RepID=A0A8S1AP89_ARCPL|nr:unnamed protein product [Arctia plantaginis]